MCQQNIVEAIKKGGKKDVHRSNKEKTKKRVIKIDGEKLEEVEEYNTNLGRILTSRNEINTEINQKDSCRMWFLKDKNILDSPNKKITDTVICCHL